MAEEQPESSPTKAVRDPQSFRGALEEWVRAKRPELPDQRVHDVDMPRSTGFSNETVFFSVTWTAEGGERTQRYVARIEPRDGGIFPVQTPPCADSVALQYEIMQAVGATGVAPVPPTIGYEGDRAVLGSPFFVMEFVPGVIPADVPRYSTDGFLVDEATPEERERMVTSGVETMAAINGIDWKAAGLEWLDASSDGSPTIQTQLAIYRAYVERELAELGGREHPVMMRGLDWLDANAPGAPTGLSWGDSRLGNMIWQDYRCAAVVDWEAAALCPPEADIGWWVMFDRQSFEDMEAPRLEGFPTRERMVEIWEARTGRRVAADIDYWEIYATMRFCAIMIKLGHRMVRAGIVPPDNTMSIDNGVTQALDRLLKRQGA